MVKIENSKDIYIGVDIGKTKVAVGLVTNKGNIIIKESLPTDMVNGGEKIISQCRLLIKNILQSSKNKPKGIGIGSSGVINHKTGTILSSGSIPNWSNIELKKIFEREFSIPVFLDNDVYVAGLGEYFFGAGHKVNTSVFLVISTGIGLCTIQKGKILRGAHNLAGQIAHIPLFGNKFTVNDLSSGSGISSRATKLLGYSVTAKDVFNLALKDQQDAKKILYEAIKGASITIAWIQNTIDPDIIILGGSVALNEKYFVKNIKKEVSKLLIKYKSQLPKKSNIVCAELGNDAGIIGGVALCIVNI